jgi:hypothetical protein
MTTQLVNVFLTADAWVVVGMSQTTYGVWIANFQVRRLALDSRDDELGNAVLEILAQSQQRVPHPKDWTDFNRRNLDSLGVKNLNKFESESKLIAVESDGSRLALTPNRHRGRQQGYEPLKSKICVTELTGMAVGQGVRAAQAQIS